MQNCESQGYNDYGNCTIKIFVDIAAKEQVIVRVIFGRILRILVCIASFPKIDFPVSTRRGGGSVGERP